MLPRCFFATSAVQISPNKPLRIRAVERILHHKTREVKSQLPPLHQSQLTYKVHKACVYLLNPSQ